MDIKELCIDCFKPTGGEEVCMNCGCIQVDKPRQLVHLYPHTILRDRYLVGRVINNGGFGVVYKAYDMKLETIVAIKELLPTQNGLVNRIPNTKDVICVNAERAQHFQNFKMRFLQEAQTMAQFSGCDSIVHIYDFFEENNTAYLVMEFLDGVTLREFLDSNGERLDYNTAMQIIYPIMEALKQAHKNNVIHRDVSPDNIFMCKNGKVKLIDFGAARFNEAQTDNNNSIIMKPGYTPPEQYRSKGKVGPYTDIYSVGAVLYAIVTGQIPEESIDRAEKDTLQRPTKLGVQMPIYAEKSIMKAMSLRETARFKTMDDFMLALQGKKKADYPEVELKKKKILRAVSVVLVFAIMISSVFVVYHVNRTNSLVPTGDATLTVWYKEGSEGLNNRWDNISTEFAEFAKMQEKPVNINIKAEGIPADEYDERLKKAFEDGTAPDIFEASGSYTDSYCESLKPLYDEIDEKNFSQCKAYSAMMSTYSESDKIALCYDTPVLYTYTDFNYIEKPDAGMSLDQLSGNKANNGKFSYTLLCNPDAVLYAAYAYGYADGSENASLELLYNQSKVFDEKNNYVTPVDVFTSESNNTQYYIGMMSEYSIINKNSRAGQGSFDVSCLTGDAINYYVYPEVWGVNKKASTNNKQASQFLLYFLLCTVDGQSDITKANNNTYYLPMNNSAIENIGYKDDYDVVYSSEKAGSTAAQAELEKVMSKRDKLSALAKNKETAVNDMYNALSE